MTWRQLSFDIDRPRLEQAEDLLVELGAMSVTYRDAQDNPILEPAPGQTPLWDRVRVTGLFEAQKLQHPASRELIETALCATLGEALELDVEALEDQDWERAWMRDFKPMRFGRRLWICPSGQTPPEPGALTITLDPGLAFGTGTHPTTALCLGWLDAHAPEGLAVIDYGCGSGILGIAALKLGAKHVWAVDIDPQALTATRDNAQKNALPESAIETAYPEALPALEADLLMANILSGPLRELAPRLAGLTRPGGRIILSGILGEQAGDVITAYAPWFDMGPPVLEQDWTLLHGNKRE